VVIAIVASAVVRIGKRTLCHPGLAAYAAAAFIAIYFLSIPFPYVIGAAALSGLILQRWTPRVFQSCELLHAVTASNIENSASSAVARFRPSPRRDLYLGAIFLALWGVPVLVLRLWPGAPDVLEQEALFFTKAPSSLSAGLTRFCPTSPTWR